MGMSNAERQRKFRENRNKDLVKREAYLNKEKERYQKEKRTGKKKSVKDMTEREKRSARKKWRTAKHKERSAKKTLLKLITPPNTPESSPNLQPGPSRQKVQSVKKRNRDQAKCYRDNKILEDKLAKQKRKIQMYKQRYLREKRKRANLDKPCPDTPRTKTKKLLRNFPQKEVRKTLIYHYAMEGQIKQSYQNLKDNSQKRSLAAILRGSLLRKYNLKTTAYRNCGIDVRNTLKVKTSLSRRMCKPVREFYERNDVSRLSTGVKQTVTFKKIKKQRRILLDTLQNIHLKFLAESTTKVSYSTFCRLRPFWVVFPNESDRSTCLCKLCENTKYIASALKKSNIIETDELEKIIDGLTCDQDTYLLKRRCMFGTCEVCKNNRISYDTSKGNDEVEFSQWTSKIEKRLVKEEEKNITLTVKETMEMSASDLVNKFEDELVRFKKHVFTIRAQYGYFKNRKQSLKKDECLLHIDFSENYVCKMSEEIQSMHFGASKKQLSLHTGVYYVSNYQKTFCTVSENLQHGPAGIWAHLKPILKRIKQESPDVTSLEIFSDGPTTQYRQKGNFYLACTNLPKYGFQNFCWNFFEAGHGKGIPDAVGGALKRHADTEVKFGKDITNADIFLDCMSNSESVGYLVSDRDIQKEQKLLQAAQLKPIPGTMKLHQLIFQKDYEIAYRNISCTCQEPSDCSFCTGQEIKFSRILADKKQQEVKTKLKPQSLESPYAIDLTEENGPSKPKKAKSEEHTNTELPFDMNEAIYSLKDVKSHRQLKSRCSQLIKDLGTLESNPLMVNIMDQRMEVDAKAMDNYPDDVPDTRALYPCKVSSDGNCLPSCGSVFAHKSEFKASEIRLRIVIELVQNEHLYLDNNFLLKGTTNTKSSKNLPTIYAQYSDMYLPGIHLTENIIRSIYQKEIMKIRLDKTYMGIWQIHALSSVLCTPIYSVYPKLGNPNVRQDLNRLILPREYKHKQPIYIFWTSTRSADMNNEHWVPNHFVPILPIDNIIIEDNGRKEFKTENIDTIEDQNQHEKEKEGKSEIINANVEGNKIEVKSWFIEEIKVESGNLTEKGREVKNEEKSEEESKNQENNKGESENVGCLQSQTDKGQRTSLSENEENNKEESENLENNNKESENIENSIESEKVEKGEETAIAENKAEKIENVQKIEEKPINVDEKEESKKKTEENPEKEESKEKNEEESENVEKKQEKNKNQREKEIKVENAKQSDEESGKVENANEVGETIGNPSEIESLTCNENDTNWKDVPDPSKCVGKYVVIKYDEKPYPGVVEDAGESDIYVQCMHRVGKKDNNCFFWPRTIKDKCWYEFDDVLAVIPEPTKIEGSYSHYKIDQDIWNQITDELK